MSVTDYAVSTSPVEEEVSAGSKRMRRIADAIKIALSFSIVTFVSIAIVVLLSAIFKVTAIKEYPELVFGGLGVSGVAMIFLYVFNGYDDAPDESM